MENVLKAMDMIPGLHVSIDTGDTDIKTTFGAAEYALDGSRWPALQPAGLIDAFRRLVLEDREAIRILDREGNVLFDQANDGAGADLAMYDGAGLGEAIVAHSDDIEAALAEYEQAMFSRSADAANEGAQLQQYLFGDNAPCSLVNASKDGQQTG